MSEYLDLKNRLKVRHIDPTIVDQADAPIFSICSLVNKPDIYLPLLQSFEKGGFIAPLCEYLIIDNEKANTAEAYGGLRSLINAAKGAYVILCHQDVRLIKDDFSTLTAHLKALDALDPSWALAGNAGRDENGAPLMCISDRFGDNQRQGILPAKAVSLDENFIILKRNTLVSPSQDLKGWHLYGADLCIQAALKGHSAYVIDFHLKHESGVLRIDESYFACLEALEDKYAKAFATRTIPTTCLTPTLSENPLIRLGAKLKRARKKFRALKKYGKSADLKG